MARTALRRAEAEDAIGHATGADAAAENGRRAVDPGLPIAVDGRRLETIGESGRLGYYVAGEGAPLLLIHSVNAAASAYEVKPLFEALASERRVYAVDLPGFGSSERAERAYDVPLYCSAIRDMLAVIDRDCGAATRVDALAISLSSEFLARVAGDEPERFRTLTFVTPTGFDKRSPRRRAPAGTTREIPGLHSLLSVPLWSQPLFDLLVSERGIRYFLQKTFGSKDIDEGLAAYDYVTAHRPGARFAPLAFVSGRLFSADIHDVYDRVRTPVWMPHATRGDFKDFSGADWVRCRSGWTVQPFPTGALPHFQEPEKFIAVFRNFLSGAEKSAR